MGKKQLRSGLTSTGTGGSSPWLSSRLNDRFVYEQRLEKLEFRLRPFRGADPADEFWVTTGILDALTIDASLQWLQP